MLFFELEEVGLNIFDEQLCWNSFNLQIEGQKNMFQKH